MLSYLQPSLASSTPAAAESDDSFVVNIGNVAVISVANAFYRATKTPPSPYALPLYYQPTEQHNELHNHNHVPAADYPPPAPSSRKPFTATTVKQLDHNSLPKRTLSPKQNFIGDSNSAHTPRRENSENHKGGTYIKENIRLRKDVAKLRGVVATAHDRTSSLEETNKHLQMALDESVGHVTDKQNRIVQLENECTSLKSKHAELKQQNAHQSALVDSLRTEHSNETVQLREELTRLQDSIAMKERTIQSLEAERDSLRTAVDGLNQRLDERSELYRSLLKELELLTALYEKAHANHAAQRELLESRASQLEEKNEQLFQTAVAFEMANTGLQQDNAYLRRDNEQLQRTLGQCDSVSVSPADGVDGAAAPTVPLNELEYRRQITQLRGIVKIDREHWAKERRIWERHAAAINQLWRDEWSKRELRIQAEMDQWRRKMEDDA